jgi:pimeloyl-ACP methyl ester carboxylesterase
MPITRSTLWKWTKRSLRYLLLLILIAAIGGITYQFISCAYGDHKYPPPGILLDVGGRSMHLYCTGAAPTTTTPAPGAPAANASTAPANENQPTVILDAGLGDFSISSWVTVQPDISRFARVCSYDRAGIGWSDSAPSREPRDAEHIAADLDALLKAGKVPPPYILVGHSLAGYYVRVFAGHHRDEVAGVALVDSSYPNQFHLFPPAMLKAASQQFLLLKILPDIIFFGYPRLFGACSGFPPTAPAALRAAEAEIGDRECRYAAANSIKREFFAIDASSAQVLAAGNLGDTPLVVLSQDPNNKEDGGLPPQVAQQFSDAWVKFQEDLTHLSTNSSHVVAIGSGHYIQRARPDLVLAAIHKLLTASSTPHH